jgi:hypothetical protein
MYIQLRRQISPNNTGVGAPYTATVAYFDTVLRKPYYTQQPSQVNDPAELATDAEVYRYEYKPGFVRAVYYNGNGSVYTKNLSGVSVSSLAAKADTTSPYTEADDSADASVDITGHLGVPPYQITLTGTIGNPSANYHQTGVSPSENYPVRFFNMPQGEYVAIVKDALGNIAPLDIKVLPGTGKARGALLLQQAFAFIYNLNIWRFNNLDVKYYPSFEQLVDKDLLLPYGQYVDGFLLAGSNGKTWRQVYSDGKGGVYFIDTDTTPKSLLELDNLIIFHPDTPNGLGGFIVEVNATAGPVTFTLGAQTNTTGRFDGLLAGSYLVQVKDAVGATLSVPIALVCRYSLRWELDFDDLHGTPLRFELWLRDYAGPVETLFGGGDNPVLLKSDGLSSSLGGQGDIPPVVGTSAELTLLVEPGTLESVLLADDRECRCDVFRAGQLEFRGYVQPDVYSEPLLDGLVQIELTATDGLAGLKDTDFLGHIGQRLYNHRPILHNLLHCLSRTSITLPLSVFVNRRDATMADNDAPELVATTNRTGYWDESKNEPEQQRNVVDALAQALGGTLCQRGGTWQIRSALEALIDTPGRSYLPAGTTDSFPIAFAPTDTVTPSTLGPLFWIDANQLKKVRAGWKSLTGETDAGWLKNAFPSGAVFSDKYAWLADFSKLRAVAGWHPAAGASFPLIFTRAGDKGSDYSTVWPRSINGSQADGRYLESPLLPLAAGTEAVPAVLTFSAKLVPTDYYQDAQGNSYIAPITPDKAVLPYEIIIDGQSTGQRLAEFKQVASSAAKDLTFEAVLPPLPSTAGGAVLRLYSWFATETDLLATSKVFVPSGLGIFQKDDVVRYDFGTGVYRLFVARQDNAYGFAFFSGPSVYSAFFYEIPATNAASGQLLLSSVAVQLRPQGATWEAEDNFRADGPAGTVRPTEVLKVYHPDPPLSAGLFGGNLFAFGRGVGLIDGTQPTSWARKIDLKPTPLFEANVLDGLALRTGSSRLVPGTLRYNTPVRLLDTLDLPYDIPGRRFFVASTAWGMRAQKVEVSLTEIGPSADATDPLLELPDGVRIVHQFYEYKPGFFTPLVRMTQDGRVRVRHA